MRRRSAAALGAAVALLAATPALATTPKSRLARCAPRHSRVVAADAQAEVYVLPESAKLQINVAGCVVGQRQTHVLGRPFGASTEGAGGIERATIAGTVVGYEQSQVPGVNQDTASYNWIVVRDLRTGRVVHKVPTGERRGANPLGSVGAGRAVTIVVKADGAVAWIAEPLSGEYEVHALDRQGERLVAHGPDVEPHSLALRGSTLSWEEAGARSSAILD
jgi:hypothetical protein